MNKAVIGILLLLISGLAGAFVYIRKLRAKSAESAEKLQAASSQVTSLQTSLKDKEDSAEREAQELRKEAAASSKKLEEEKKAKKAELMRIAAERKAEKARRDALEKLKDAKIAELSEKQKRHEADIAKTEERRQAALKEADTARAKASAARSEADRAIADARRSKQLADRARFVADRRANQAGIEIRRAKSQQKSAAKAMASAKAQIRKKRVIRGIGVKTVKAVARAAKYKFSRRNRKTPSNDWGGGNSIYLDRHNMDCGNDAIRQFRLYRPAGNRIAYNYSCLEGTNSSRYNTTTRRRHWYRGDTTRLKYHRVDCGNRNIHRIRLYRPSTKTTAYSYSCGRRGVATNTCRNHYTPWNKANRRNIYLDRHNVSCPGNTALTRFQLERGRFKRYGQMRYAYRCCQPA